MAIERRKVYYLLEQLSRFEMSGSYLCLPEDWRPDESHWTVCTWMVQQVSHHFRLHNVMSQNQENSKISVNFFLSFFLLRPGALVNIIVDFLYNLAVNPPLSRIFCRRRRTDAVVE